MSADDALDGLVAGISAEFQARTRYEALAMIVPSVPERRPYSIAPALAVAFQLAAFQAAQRRGARPADAAFETRLRQNRITHGHRIRLMGER